MSRVILGEDPVGRRGTARTVPLSQLVDQWLSEGLVTPAQAERLRQPVRQGEPEQLVELPPPDARPRRASTATAVEALGYVGGVAVVVATILIAGMYWEDLTTAARLLLVGLAAVVLVGAGLAVPERLGPPGGRLRSALHLGGTVAVAGFLALLGSEVFDLQDEHVAVMAASGAAACAAALWVLHRVLLQQVAMMVALMVTAAVVVADVAGGGRWAGWAAWAVAVVWFLLGRRQLLRPERAVLVIASAAAVVASMTTTETDAGMVLALVTTGGVVVIGVRLSDIALLAVGAVGLLQALPVVVGTWFPDTVLAPFVLLVVGVLLLLAALFTAVRRRRPPGSRSVGGSSKTGTSVR